MNLVKVSLVVMIALSVSSCRLIGKSDEAPEATLESQLTPVKPEAEAEQTEDAAPETETPPAN